MSSAEEQLHERETSGDSDAAVYVKQRRRRVEKVAQRVSAGKVRQMMTSAAGAAPACPAKQSNRVAPPGARPFLIAYPPLARWANLWSRLTALGPSQILDELVASTGPHQGTTSNYCPPAFALPPATWPSSCLSSCCSSGGSFA